jgi:hypothetical protein
MADVIPLRRPASVRTGKGPFDCSESIGRLIPGGDELDQVGTFGDDVWDLAGHRSWKDKVGGFTRLDFTKVSEPWRDAVKELCLFQMSPELAMQRAPHVPMADAWQGIQEPIAPVTAQGNLKMLSHALRVIDAQNISTFDPDDWDRLIALLVQPFDVTDKQGGATLSTSTGRGRAQQLIALWQTSHISGRDGLLGLDPPFGGRPTTALYASRSKRNAVRPHENVGHMLGYCAWVFDHIAEDIVAHLEWWSANSTDEQQLNSADLREAMLDLCGEMAKRSGGVLPGVRNVNGGLTLAHSTLGRLLGCYDPDDAFLAGRWAMSQLRGSATLSEDFSPCPVPVSELPSVAGRLAWAPRLLASKDSLDIWQRRLAYCAMFYLSATVMLRDSQLAVLALDPITTETVARPDGTSYTKHTLRAHKTKNRHSPVPTTVTVNGRVAYVVSLMQRMQRCLGYEPGRSATTGQRILFDQRLATPYGKATRVDARDGLYLDSSFVHVMKEGAAELHHRGVLARDLTDNDLSMRQVRITCAQAFAVREHGQALAAAFGQWDTSRVQQGYVGDVFKLITPLEPEEAIDLQRQDTGRRLVRAVSNREVLTGKGLARLDQAAEASRIPVTNPQPLSPSRLRNLGKLNPHIEQGPLTLCLYQPEGAMCGGKGKPDFRLCLPGECRNSVMTPVDRARYELMRRQHLSIGSDVASRAANRMNDANPEIAISLSRSTDEDLQNVIISHVDDYIQAALEDRA